jgi:hypothetical protein
MSVGCFKEDFEFLASSSGDKREPHASGIVEAAVCKLLWVSITFVSHLQVYSRET